MGEKVPPPIEISGIEDLQEWPLETRVVHDDPFGNVILTFHLEDFEEASVEVRNRSEIIGTYTNDDTELIIPADILQNAVAQKLTIELFVNGINYGGLIKFLPLVESEPFPNQGYINASGSFVSNVSYVATDFIDLLDTIDVVYSGKTAGAAVGAVYYNESKQVISNIGNGTRKNKHLTLPEGCRYIRVCGLESISYSLKLYFPTRG